MPSKKKLNLRRYTAVFPTEYGTTNRVNHEECPAGEDTKRRLYITKTESGNGLILGYCHNCGSSGVISRTVKHWRRPASTVFSTKEYNYPYDNVIPYWDFNEAINKEGRSLIEEYLKWSPFSGIVNEGLLKFIAMGWNTHTNRWHLPVSALATARRAPGRVGDWVWDYDYIHGHNERAHYADQSPKWLLSTGEDFRGYTVNKFNEIGVPENIVLVEDQLSARAIPYHGIQNYGVCLYGASSSLEKIHAIYRLYNKPETNFVVWLDNDNTIVKQQAHNLCQYLKLLGAKVSEVREPLEPKKIARTEQFYQILKAAHKYE